VHWIDTTLQLSVTTKTRAEQRSTRVPVLLGRRRLHKSTKNSLPCHSVLRCALNTQHRESPGHTIGHTRDTARAHTSTQVN
jgi:hypothetical protein